MLALLYAADAAINKSQLTCDELYNKLQEFLTEQEETTPSYSETMATTVLFQFFIIAFSKYIHVHLIIVSYGSVYNEAKCFWGAHAVASLLLVHYMISTPPNSCFFFHLRSTDYKRVTMMSENFLLYLMESKLLQIPLRAAELRSKSHHWSIHALNMRHTPSTAWTFEAVVQM